MSWKKILKNKVPTFEETGAFDEPEDDEDYTWDEAFSKFGFSDGRNKDLTDVVVKFIEGLGYEVGITSTGPHNDYIHLIINKDGENIYSKGDDLSKLDPKLHSALENKFKLGV
jgi:hypothetical protein